MDHTTITPLLATTPPLPIRHLPFGHDLVDGITNAIIDPR